MNAAAFLALVGRDPPPWTYDYEEGYRCFHPRHGDLMPVTDSQAIADAAPQMAAAILRLLAWAEGKVGRDFEEVLLDLRDALPEDLRP